MKPLKGKRIVLLAAHEFEDVELLYTLLRLSEEGAEIHVATLPPDAAGHFHTRPHWPEKPITGRFGSTVPFHVFGEGNRWHHKSTANIWADDYDAVVIPGGFAPDYLRIDRAVLEFVADMYTKGKVVAAICHGPQVLISTDVEMGTDIIKGRRVCGWLAVQHDLTNAGGTFVDEPAVQEDNVITGRVPDDLPEFCHAIIATLAAN